MSRNIDKEIALFILMKKWSRIISIEAHSFMQTPKGEVLVLNFLGYEVDSLHPDELLNLLALMHKDIKDSLGHETEIKYLKSFPLLDSIY